VIECTLSAFLSAAQNEVCSGNIDLKYNASIDFNSMMVHKQFLV
jgi:hypothetical protein